VRRAAEPVARFRTTLDVTVRRCRAADLRALEWFGIHTASRDVIESAYMAQRNGHAVVLVADVGGFPAAQVWLDFRRKRPARCVTIWALRVFPPLRGCGIGTDLMRVAEAVAVERGSTTAELAVEETNVRARRFYERLGYALADRGDGATVLTFRKALVGAEPLPAPASRPG